MENAANREDRGGAGKCASCGENFSASFKFCPYCGSSAAKAREVTIEAPQPGVAKTAADAGLQQAKPGKQISPEAKKALEEFDMKFDQLLQSRNNKKSKGASGTASNTKMMYVALAGAVMIIIALVVFFVMNSMMRMPKI